MKTFPLNLKHFKKIKMDEHASVLKNKDGHEIKIAHAKLKPELREQLDALPHYADGTPDGPITVQDYDPSKYVGTGDISVAAAKARDEQEALAAKQARQKQYEQSNASLPKTLEEARQQEQLARMPAGSKSFDQMPKDANRTLASAPTQTVNPMSELLMRAGTAELGGLEEQRLGALGAAQAQATGAAQAQKNISNENKLFEDQMAKHQADHDYLTNERATLNTAVQNGTINPERYLQNLNAGQRILNAVGLIVSGFGAGLTHSPNLAAQMIEKSIDNDIMAQKAEMGKRDNLLTHNLQMLGNTRAAMDMLRLQHNDMVSNYLKQAAMTTQNLTAQAQLKSIAGEYDIKNAQLQRQMAMQNYLFAQPQGAESAQPGALKKESVSPFIGAFVPEKQQEAANKELGKLQETVSVKKGLRDAFNDLDSQVLAGTFSPADRQSAINTYAGLIARASAGRYNENEARNQLEAIMPGGFESQETRDKKRVRADQFFDTMAQAPTLDGSRIPYQQYEATSLKGASFANKQRYKFSGGKKYMRGPNGEAIEVK